MHPETEGLELSLEGPACMHGVRAHVCMTVPCLCPAKAHLKRAILGQEEALRLHTLCRVPRKVDLLQVVVTQALRRSLTKYSELEREDDFFEAMEAPDIQREHRGPFGMGIPVRGPS